MSKINLLARYLGKAHENIAKIFFYMSGLLIFTLGIIISYDVLMRYFFLKPTSWATDFSQYFLCWSTFASAAWVYKIGGHVKITFIIEKYCSSKIANIFRIINSIIGIMVSATIAYVGFSITWNLYYKKVIIIRPIVVPKFLIVISIPLGFLILLFYFIKDVFVGQKDYNNNKEPVNT